MVVGIDIAKDRHRAFFGTPTGRTLLRKVVFENTREGFEKLLFHTDILMRRHALRKVVFGMEPTADYHKPLGEYLIRMDHMVVLVAGGAVRKNRELLDGRWDKNDTKDAANIADLEGAPGTSLNMSIARPLCCWSIMRSNRCCSVSARSRSIPALGKSYQSFPVQCAVWHFVNLPSLFG